MKNGFTISFNKATLGNPLDFSLTFQTCQYGSDSKQYHQKLKHDCIKNKVGDPTLLLLKQ